MRTLVTVALAILCAAIIVDGGGNAFLVWAGRAIGAVLGVYLGARLASAAFFASKRHYDERKKQ